MFMEVDEVAIEPKEWDAAQAGDIAPVLALKDKLHGMVLYMHALSCNDLERVSVRELEKAGVVKSITLNTRDGHG